MAPRAGQRGRQQQQEGDGGGDEGIFTPEQLDEISTMINGAVGDHMKRKLPSIIKASLDEPLKEIRSLLDRRPAGSDDPADPDDADDPDREDPPEPPRRATAGRQTPAAVTRRQGAPVQTDPQLSAMAKKISKMEAERAQERADLAREREVARAEKRDGKLRELLAGAGVEPNRLRGAVAVLREQTAYDDKANEWVIKFDDEEHDLGAGVAVFVGTDEGKAYLAPPSAGRAASGGSAAGTQLRTGAGTRPAAGASGRTRPVQNAADAKAATKQAAVTDLQEAVASLMGNNVPIG